MRRTAGTSGDSTVLRAMRDFPMHRMVVPGASGVSTARDMARFYAAHRRRWGTRRRANPAAGNRGADASRSRSMAKSTPTFEIPVRRGLGFELGGLAEPRRHWPGATSTARTMWHGGFGSSVCWGDRRLRRGDGIHDQRRPRATKREHRPSRPLRRRARQRLIAGSRGRAAPVSSDRTTQCNPRSGSHSPRVRCRCVP